MSNDDGSTRHFRRTLSAMKTLTEAEALLSEFSGCDSSSSSVSSLKPKTGTHQPISIATLLSNAAKEAPVARWTKLVSCLTSD